jgi:hypothetical protein
LVARGGSHGGEGGSHGSGEEEGEASRKEAAAERGTCTCSHRSIKCTCETTPKSTGREKTDVHKRIKIRLQ